MPYVPSKKTVPPAKDREIINPAVDGLAKQIAPKIVKNSDLKREYVTAFVEVAKLVDERLKGKAVGKTPEAVLPSAIFNAAAPYNYEGAHLGEFNFAISRLIQRVPQIKVAAGEWEPKNEIRYWIYIDTAGALRRAEDEANKLGYSTGEVFNDIKDEYKWKVNRSYEAAQIIKSGDCYDTPFYTRLIKLVDESGKHVCYTDGYFERSEDGNRYCAVSDCG